MRVSFREMKFAAKTAVEGMLADKRWWPAEDPFEAAAYRATVAIVWPRRRMVEAQQNQLVDFRSTSTFRKLECKMRKLIRKRHSKQLEGVQPTH